MLTRPVAGIALLLASTLWLAAIFAAPYAARRATTGSPLAFAAGIVYFTGSVICHQRPERSFHLDGVQLPVCARCTGIYLAAPFGALFGWIVRRSWRQDRWRRWLVGAALPTAITVAIEWAGGTMIPGPIRFAAGLPIGFVVMWYMGQVLSGPESGVRRPMSRPAVQGPVSDGVLG
ncbi:MAG TPA: DUF2085 domain-containing protein [Vicinamibacterales bacterium]|jgi:uncharacterized membrane protein